MQLTLSDVHHVTLQNELKSWGDQRARMTLDTAKRLIDEGVREGQVSLGLNGTQ